MVKIKVIAIRDHFKDQENVRHFSDLEIINEDPGSYLLTYILGKVLDNSYAGETVPEIYLDPGISFSVKMISDGKEYCFEGNYEGQDGIVFREFDTGETPGEFFRRDEEIKMDMDASEWYSYGYGRYLTLFSDLLENRICRPCM